MTVTVAAVVATAVPVPVVVQTMATSSPPTATSTSLAAEQLVAALSYSLTRFTDSLSRIPGSSIAWRYLKASHQDDPIRTLLEVLLVFFIVRTYLKGRTKGETSGKNFVKLSERVRTHASVSDSGARLTPTSFPTFPARFTMRTGDRRARARMAT